MNINKESILVNIRALMHMSSRLAEVTMEDIPELTSDILERLRGLNINSVYQLAVQTPAELASWINDAYFDVESASNLIGNARKILTKMKFYQEIFQLQMIY